ncbi:tyrosine-type recombinase/integrase [Candidatus Glomeribacter gigasporarum]|uniref:tyrosine-type recombinase/integrase n=1 Tax=Candidatus Glomeribacter gigasporarum TaxID=132144 RepID=UPI00131553A9|nr:site-specific integrase [Candidatus Glomeribacter gigasporarum]
MERLLQWAWLIAQKSVRSLGRAEIEAYVAFCQNPPRSWTGIKKAPRFLDKGGTRVPNSDWRPFVATVAKAAHGRGQRPQLEDYALSPKALAGIFAITGSFYQFLIQEGYTEVNPLLMIRQKSRYFQRIQGKGKIRRLSELQWHYVIETAEIMAQESPQHERTLFIMTALYALYLRISELAASTRWIPKMGDFYCDADGLWWFVTVGKGNKERQITVSDTMLAALRRYRRFLDLPALPSPRDQHPLIPKRLGKGPITSTSQIRVIVQDCFDRAKARLEADGFQDEAEALSEATVHWLRHTGISEDVKHRPREHVRDDAGHSSSAITDQYIDIELRARHASGRGKRVKPA